MQRDGHESPAEPSLAAVRSQEIRPRLNAVLESDLTQFVASFRGRVLADAPPLDPMRVGSVGFMISDKQAGAFRLEIAWIKAVRMPQE
jgi:hypothetical protein